MFLSAVLLLGIFLPAVEGHAAAATLVKQNGAWYYMQNGKVINTTTLVKFNGSWWYVVNGKLASNTTTLVKYNGSWWYVVNGKVASGTTSLVKFNGSWWYVVKGKVASGTTSLVKFNGSWWYVVKGKVASNTTSLVKYNGEWWYVVKGKIASSTTTLVKFNGSWYYIVKGKLAAATTTLVKYNGLWYYVKEGRVDFNADTLVPFNGGWYYVNNGTIDNQSTTYVSYNGKWYYVNKGKVNLRSQILRSPQTEFYHYNSEGQLLYSTLGAGDTYYSYDSQGRVDQVFLYYSDQKYMEWNEDYTYNADGSYRVDYFDEGCLEERYHTADGKIRNSIFYDNYSDDYNVLTYTYNSMGDLKKINAKLDWESGYQEYNKTYSYVYNSRNKPISRTEYVDGDFEYAEYYVYDAQGRVIRTLWKDNYDTYLTTHTYNQSGQLMWETTYVV